MIVPYVVFFAPACVLILILIWRQAARQGFARDRVAVAMAACATGAVIGSKLLMFDFHSPEYGEKTFLGAVVGGVVTLALVARLLRFDARAFDVPVLPVLWGAAVGRVGCLLAGCCHGLPTSLPWGIRYGAGSSAFDEHVAAGLIDAGAASSLAVHPTQLYEATLDVILAFALTRAHPRFRHPGSLALAGAVGIAAIRFAVDPMRATSVTSGAMTTVQWTTLAVMLLAGAALFLRERRPLASASRNHTTTPSPYPTAIAAAIVVILVGAGNWFTPMEQMLIGATVLAAGCVVFTSSLPAFMRSAPLLSAAVLFPLQVQDPRPDTVQARRYVAFGGGGMGGGYEVTTEDCEGNTISRTQHNYSVAAATAEFREEKDNGEGRGIRVSLFNGSDRSAGGNNPLYGQPGEPLLLPERRDAIQGGSALITMDGNVAGLSLGIATGRWYYRSNYPVYEGNAPSQTMPIGGLRLGSLRKRHAEVMFGTGVSPAPTALVRVGLAFPDSSGRNLFRLGVSDGGGYMGARFLTRQGLEIEPFAIFGGSSSYQGGIGIKQRVSLGPRKP